MQAYDGPIYIADAALYLMTKKPELGITNPYELNEEQYAAVLDVLRKQQPLVHRYWHDANVQVQDFTNEGVVASGSWPFQVNTLVANKQPIASTVPAEGATGWADTTMLAANAKHPNCAYKWMEWSLNAKVQGDVAAWFGSVPAVPAACKGNALLTDEGCAANGFDNFDKIHFWRTPEAACSDRYLRAVQPLGDGLRRGHGRTLSAGLELRACGTVQLACTRRSRHDMTAAIELRETTSRLRLGDRARSTSR